MLVMYRTTGLLVEIIDDQVMAWLRCGIRACDFTAVAVRAGVCFGSSLSCCGGGCGG